jgi:hypothetical protein
MMVAAMTWRLSSLMPDCRGEFLLVSRIRWPADPASVDAGSLLTERQLVREGPSALPADPRVAAGYV